MVSRIKRSFELEPHNFQKILEYYDNCITFCGQISDPIYHPKFLTFLKMLNGQGEGVRIATNGTLGPGMDMSFYEEAYSYGLGENAWYFGVDGIDDKSSIYRIGSNFSQVWEAMRLGKQMGHAIVWQYIIFGYNEDETERALEIAEKEGFTLLLIKTNRGFDPKARNLRGNVKEAYENFPVPSDKNRVKKIKGEEYFNVTPELAHWRKVREGLIK